MGVFSKAICLKCLLCKRSFDSRDSFVAHTVSKSHIQKAVQYVYSEKRSTLLKNKKGLTLQLAHSPVVREEDDYSIIFMRDETEQVELLIVNVNGKPVILENVYFLQPCSSLNITMPTKSGTKVLIKSGCAFTLPFRAFNRNVRTEACPMLFQFRTEGQEETFTIMKIVVVETLDKITEGILDTIPYTLNDQHNLKRPKAGEYVPGIDINGNEVNPKTAFVGFYPSELKSIMEANFDSKKLVSRTVKSLNREYLTLMRQGLHKGNYEKWFQMQLWLEEVTKEKEFNSYNMRSQTITLCEGQHEVMHAVYLLVPGIEEGRPNIIVNSSVYFRPAGKSTPIYEGIVHLIMKEKVVLAFQKKLESTIIARKYYDVQFCFNRTTFERMHKALALCTKSQYTKIIFPDPSATYRPPPKTEELDTPSHKIDFFNDDVGGNHEQSQAVTHIVNKVCAPLPYIIFGPPGTGKTITIVEAITQVYHREPESRILVCGPSNSSCDMLTERLLEYIDSRFILRVNAVSRDTRSVSPAIAKVSCFGDDEAFAIPATSRLETYRIVITTYVTAAKVVNRYKKGSLNVKDYTHLFMDEAGQGEEPETLIPLVSFPSMVVLAGDPKQLGPTISCGTCMTDYHGQNFAGAGLDQSLLERLMKSAPYTAGPDGQYNSRFVTKLLDNFRSHRSILTIPNELFYNSELRVKASWLDVCSMIGFPQLPNMSVPLIFHGVKGRDSRESNCPSYFNLHEVSKVLFYIKELLKFGVTQEDIGVISPYKNQCLKIEKAFEKHIGNSSHGIRIGSPEEFQGSENKVIIISTVRASPEYLHNDTKRQLGFLVNPKRFNVAVTRAKCLLIIIGCPFILKKDPHWNRMLEHAVKRGCYVGTDLDV